MLSIQIIAFNTQVTIYPVKIILNWFRLKTLKKQLTTEFLSLWDSWVRENLSSYGEGMLGILTDML